MPIQTITHPLYAANADEWAKYRSCYEGGRPFVEAYLEMFTKRENQEDFDQRKKITPPATHAKSAIVDIKNAIFRRMIDITREGGVQSYADAVKGLYGGVDLQGNGMNAYVGRVILPELLSMGRVGIFIDKQQITQNTSKALAKGLRPYLYSYAVEDIRSWTVDTFGNLQSLLLRDHIDVLDEETGLTTGTAVQYRHLALNNGTISVTFYDKDGKQTSSASISLPVIPFAVFDIHVSLMKDIADYQIALLNLGSSDLNYATKSNFPFYTEQYSPTSELVNTKQIVQSSTETVTDAASKQNASEVRVGVAQGRRYAKGLERPGFIHPSSEPLEVGMKKEEQLKQEIRQLTNLALTNLAPQRASMESKSFDESGKEAGLSYIALVLAYGEQVIADIWNMYEGSSDTVTIKYPQNYDLKSDKERLDEATTSQELMVTVPSKTYQREMAKKIAYTTLGNDVKHETLDAIYSEIDGATVLISDPKTIVADHEAGFVSDATASLLRGYPAGETEQAQLDHAARAARIAIAQSKAAMAGVADVSAPDTKKTTQDAAVNPIPKKGVRGPAQ